MSKNDQRANAKNPQTREHKAAADNRSEQLNPKSPKFGKKG